MPASPKPRPRGPGRRMGLRRRLGLVGAVILAASACGGGQPILAQAPALHPTPPPTAIPSATRPPDPQPIVFPRDDGPHHRLTEWWYFTGHLATADGRHFGFEFVTFRAERGTFPVSWAAHLALTDESAGTFAYDQRTEVGKQVDRSPPSGGFDLSVADLDAAGLPVPGGSAWMMAGLGGRDRLVASSAKAGFGLDLTLDPGGLPPVLEGNDGWVDFGPAGGSYYTSRPRLAAGGTLTVGGAALTVTGLAWFDHQWGDFIAIGAGGWDWFALDLDDGSAVMLSQVRDAAGRAALVYGTSVRPDGSAVHLAASDFSVAVDGPAWRSPHTGIAYPAGWRIAIPGQGLTVTLTPTVADQELDTRASTGVVYWEGSQRVSATRDGRPLGGQAYVELTGYGP